MEGHTKVVRHAQTIKGMKDVVEEIKKKGKLNQR